MVREATADAGRSSASLAKKAHGFGGADLKGVNVNAALVPPAAASKHELLVVDGLHGGGENGFDTPVGGSGSALTTPGSR